MGVLALFGLREESFREEVGRRLADRLEALAGIRAGDEFAESWRMGRPLWFAYPRPDEEGGSTYVRSSLAHHAADLGVEFAERPGERLLAIGIPYGLAGPDSPDRAFDALESWLAQVCEALRPSWLRADAFEEFRRGEDAAQRSAWITWDGGEEDTPVLVRATRSPFAPLVGYRRSYLQAKEREEWEQRRHFASHAALVVGVDVDEACDSRGRSVIERYAAGEFGARPVVPSELVRVEFARLVNAQFAKPPPAPRPRTAEERVKDEAARKSLRARMNRMLAEAKHLPKEERKQQEAFARGFLARFVEDQPAPPPARKPAWTGPPLGELRAFVSATGLDAILGVRVAGSHARDGFGPVTLADLAAAHVAARASLVRFGLYVRSEARLVTWNSSDYPERFFAWE